MRKVIATMFSNPSWKLSQNLSYPNTLGALNYNGAKIGVLAVLRGRGRDFPLSEAGLEYLLKMEQEGRIAADAQVSLFTRPAKKSELPEFIATEKATVVRDNIGDAPPQNGEYGPHWWITAEFKPSASSSGRRYDPDEIF